MNAALSVDFMYASFGSTCPASTRSISASLSVTIPSRFDVWITDDDVSALKDAGVSEDEIFEQTVATAVGEGLRRLDAAHEAIG